MIIMNTWTACGLFSGQVFFPSLRMRIENINRFQLLRITCLLYKTKRIFPLLTYVTKRKPNEKFNFLTRFEQRKSSSLYILWIHQSEPDMVSFFLKKELTTNQMFAFCFNPILMKMTVLSPWGIQFWTINLTQTSLPSISFTFLIISSFDYRHYYWIRSIPLHEFRVGLFFFKWQTCSIQNFGPLAVFFSLHPVALSETFCFFFLV